MLEYTSSSMSILAGRGGGEGYQMLNSKVLSWEIVSHKNRASNIYIYIYTSGGKKKKKESTLFKESNRCPSTEIILSKPIKFYKSSTSYTYQLFVRTQSK